MTAMIRTHTSTLSAKRGSRGFSLLEVLIALIVFSIGMLGIGGLQLLSKQNNFEAIQRTTAAMLAQDMIERMRANPYALLTYVSNTGATTVGGGTMASTATDCVTSACDDRDDLAVYDLKQWEMAIDGVTETNDGNNVGGLVQPTGCITGPNDGSDGVYIVTLAWQGKTELSDTAKSGNTCGAGLYGANDEYRRLLSITTFITR